MEPRWCTYIQGKCEHQGNALLCAKQSTVSCRLRREKNEAKEEKEDAA